VTIRANFTKEDHALYQRDWRLTNPKSNWFSKIKHRYGLNKLQALFIKNKPGCEICGKSTGKLCIDHDHGSGQVRGQLCDDCNVAMGRFKDSPELLHKALHYLEIIAPLNIAELDKLKG
jgi:hypothetical protein